MVIFETFFDIQKPMHMFSKNNQKIFFLNSKIRKSFFIYLKKYILKTHPYYCVEWKIEQTRFLYIEKRFTNNDFRGIFCKQWKIWRHQEKNDFLLIDFFKNLFYSKFNADSNAKKKTF